MLPYSPFTSENLTAAATLGASDLSSVADLSSGLPDGKQVIFFSIGFVCIIASIALISRILIANEVTPDALVKLATLAA